MRTHHPFGGFESLRYFADGKARAIASYGNLLRHDFVEIMKHLLFKFKRFCYGLYYPGTLIPILPVL